MLEDWDWKECEWLECNAILGAGGEEADSETFSYVCGRFDGTDVAGCAMLGELVATDVSVVWGGCRPKDNINGRVL